MPHQTLLLRSAPESRPPRRTANARLRLSNPFVGAANLTPRHRRTQAGDPLQDADAGEESGVTGDGRSVELQLDLAVEIDAQGVMVAGRVGAETMRDDRRCGTTTDAP
jgi:hypothetical protein